MNIPIGNTDYRIVTVEQSGSFCAHAVRVDNGERFGIEATAASQEEAQQRLARWLEWQHDHTQALESLQQAERLYHRSVTGAAFATGDDGSTGDTQVALDQVDAARQHLDEVRARRPNV